MEKAGKPKILSMYTNLVGAALAAMKRKSTPTLGSYSTPKGLTYRATGRSHLHAGHIREIKKHQRRRTFFASLRK